MLKRTETYETIRNFHIFIISGIRIWEGPGPLPPPLATPIPRSVWP